jgi:hypothetical protein
MVKRLSLLFFIAVFAGMLISCKDEDQRFSDLSTRIGKYNAEGELQVENQRAFLMEADLSRRYRFYQAIKGTYEGSFESGEGAFAIRFVLVPSLPPYPADATRVRTIEEVTSDLTNLYFNAQIVQWNPKNTLSAVGCRVEGVRPDMTTGEIFIASENCPNFYMLRLAAPTPISPENSTTIASGIISGNIVQVLNLEGELRPSTNANIYRFVVTRSLP